MTISTISKLKGRVCRESPEEGVLYLAQQVTTPNPARTRLPVGRRLSRREPVV